MDWSELVTMFLFCGIFGHYMIYEPYPWRMLQSLTYQVNISNTLNYCFVLNLTKQNKGNIERPYLTKIRLKFNKT